jgi:hypothetical protein
MYGEFSSPGEFFSFRGKRDVRPEPPKKPTGATLQPNPYSEYFASDLNPPGLNGTDDAGDVFEYVGMDVLEQSKRYRRATGSRGRSTAPPAINTDSSRYICTRIFMYIYNLNMRIYLTNSSPV